MLFSVTCKFIVIKLTAQKPDFAGHTVPYNIINMILILYRSFAENEHVYEGMYVQFV